MSQDMGEEPLQRAEDAIQEGRRAADAAPIMPFDDPPAGRNPDETGGHVAMHGDDEPGEQGEGEEPGDDAQRARTQIGQPPSEESRSATEAAEQAEREAVEAEER